MVYKIIRKCLLSIQRGIIRFRTRCGNIEKFYLRYSEAPKTKRISGGKAAAKKERRNGRSGGTFKIKSIASHLPGRRKRLTNGRINGRKNEALNTCLCGPSIPRRPEEQAHYAAALSPPFHLGWGRNARGSAGSLCGHCGTALWGNLCESPRPGQNN